MAKSSRLPSPEEFRARLQKRRQAAKQAFRDELQPIRDANGKLDVLAEELSARWDTLVDAIGAVSEQIQSGPQPIQPETIDNSLMPLIRDIRAVLQETQRIYGLLASTPAPQPAEVDLSGIESRLDGLARPIKPEIVRVAEPTMPEAVHLRVTGRDDNGDIETVDVEVVKH